MHKSDNYCELLVPIDNQFTNESIKYGFFCHKAKIFFQFSDIKEYQSFLEAYKKQPKQKNISYEGGSLSCETQDFGDFDYIVSEMQQKGREKIYQQQMMIIEEF